jgi:hypothetical protein
MTRRVRQAQILSAGELRTVIERERAIVDRHGNAFSLLVFCVGNTNLVDVAIQHLVRTLRCRVRSTDEVGWLDGQRIGVVLPYTSSQGQRAVAVSSPEWQGPGFASSFSTIMSSSGLTAGPHLLYLADALSAGLYVSKGSRCLPS